MKKLKIKCFGEHAWCFPISSHITRGVELQLERHLLSCSIRMQQSTKGNGNKRPRLWRVEMVFLGSPTDSLQSQQEPTGSGKFWLEVKHTKYSSKNKTSRFRLILLRNQFHLYQTWKGLNLFLTDSTKCSYCS